MAKSSKHDDCTANVPKMTWHQGLITPLKNDACSSKERDRSINRLLKYSAGKPNSLPW